MQIDRALRPLDLDQVAAFVLVADLRSFTRAAEAAGVTQSAISLKLKRLERQLGRRLVERTPRLVRLSAEGASFLDRARDLLAAHDRAVGRGDAVARLSFGISDHAAGPELALLLARVSAHDPNLRLDVRIDTSRDMLDAFDRGAIDAVIVRREGARRDGETLLTDRLGWFASSSYRHPAGEPLRLASLSDACGVRALAVRALEAAGIAWIEAFVGGGIAAVAAAVTSGLAVAPLARRIAPPGAVDVGPALQLPELPASDVVLHSRVSDPQLAGALRVLAAAFRSVNR
jgi:DNA-binding transcriptional LysR family regulator